MIRTETENTSDVPDCGSLVVHVHITDHADTRIKERLGLPKSARQKAAEKAYAEGKQHSETKGKLHRYLDGLWLQKGNANKMRLYSNHVWMFNDNTLITVWEIPKNLQKGIR
jgi:hypothetical protein